MKGQASKPVGRNRLGQGTSVVLTYFGTGFQWLFWFEDSYELVGSVFGSKPEPTEPISSLTCIAGSDVAQPLLNPVPFEGVHDKRSDELAGVSVVELRHSEKCMLESAVCTYKSSIDGLELSLMVDAARPAVCTDVDT